MKERIKELAEQAYLYQEHDTFLIAALERFAELLVENCITLCEEIGTKQDGQYCADKIKEHFSEDSN